MLNFVFDEFFWVAETTFDSWRGFQSRYGSYGAQSSKSSSNGAVKVVFAPEGRPGQDSENPLTAVELALVNWFLEREATVSAALLSALFNAYPTLQAKYGYDAVERRELMPNLKDAGDLKNLIGLHTIHIQPLTKSGVPYVGYELGCTWDAEHGLGILMHGERPVDIGGSDSAFLFWIAEQDANKSE